MKEEFESAVSLLLLLSIAFLILAAFCCFGEAMQSVALVILTVMSVVLLVVTLVRALK